MFTIWEKNHLQHIQIVNKTSSLKAKLIGNNAEAIPFEVSHGLDSTLPVIKWTANSGQRRWHLPLGYVWFYLISHYSKFKIYSTLHNVI